MTAEDMANRLTSIVAVNVRRLADARGLTLAQLATDARIGTTTLRRLLDAASDPRLSTLWALANALDVDVRHLLGPDGFDAAVTEAALEEAGRRLTQLEAELAATRRRLEQTTGRLTDARDELAEARKGIRSRDGVIERMTQRGQR